MKRHHPLPNHHADHAGFRGASGLAAALGFLVGRDGDAQLATRLVDLRPGDRLIDIGCGPGVAARHAALLGAEVIGVDPAAVMLQVARRRTSDRTLRVNWRTGTAEALPVEDRWATAIWSIATVHHWQDVDVALGEVTRVLAPAGRFTVLERRIPEGATGHASHGWTATQADSFAAYCTDHGFEDVRVSTDSTSRGTILGVSARKPGGPPPNAEPCAS